MPDELLHTSHRRALHRQVRNAGVTDPHVATICAHTPAHPLPPPQGTFVWDELITDNVASAKLYYDDLFGWEARAVGTGNLVFQTAGGTEAAGAMERPSVSGAAP